MGWRIDAWSREHGKGRITSEAGTLDFDASVALVEDFVAGELVDIVLEHGEVRRIQPQAARSAVAAIATQLPAGWGDAIATMNARFDELTAVAVVGATSDRLVIELQHDEWPPPHMPARCTATFEEVDYVQIPMRSSRFETVTARRWSDILAARPAWLDAFSIELDDVAPDMVLVCFESSEFGVRAGFVIARSITVT